MSTEIWVAYKLLNPNDLWPLVHDIRQKTKENIRKELIKLYAMMILGVDASSKEYKKAYSSCLPKKPREGIEPLMDFKARKNIVRTSLIRGYKRASTSYSQEPFNFDVSVGFRHLNGSIFLIPHYGSIFLPPFYGNMSLKWVLDFLKDDPRIVDYHYQNQTDKPKEIPSDEWESRRKTWHAMLELDTWEDVLVLDICRYDTWYKVDPYSELTKEMFDGLTGLEVSP